MLRDEARIAGAAFETGRSSVDQEFSSHVKQSQRHYSIDQEGAREVEQEVGRNFERPHYRDSATVHPSKTSTLGRECSRKSDQFRMAEPVAICSDATRCQTSVIGGKSLR